ncbi:hypothetical protein [Sulfurimonas indica]|uniref:hypothetical protein n=1 Tax=Sulfurimonas TaxID=202746 RepID=UPI001264E313|nr:hypothetical protein [Sulfurimonas indica]
MKKILSILLLASTMYATNVEIVKNDRTKTFNQVDDNYSDEKGFAFYEDLSQKKQNKKTAKQKNCCSELLKISKKILKENEKQTKIQEKILKLLQSSLDPKPKKITVNGRECIENSSAECFKMPLTPEAKSIPAMAAWMKDPNMKNTVNYLQWQAKYFKEIFKRADALPMAVTQFGDKAYPLPNQPIGYTDIMGFDNNKQQIKQFMKEVNKKYSYILFLGLNVDLDMISIYEVSQLINKYPNVELSFVFSDKKAEKMFKQAMDVLFSPKMKERINKGSMTISKKLFNTYGIYTTPSIVAVNKKEKTANTISTGRLQIDNLERKMYNLLEYQGKLDYKKFIKHNTWNKDVNYRDRYFKNKLGIDINSFMKEKE